MDVKDISQLSIRKLRDPASAGNSSKTKSSAEAQSKALQTADSIDVKDSSAKKSESTVLRERVNSMVNTVHLAAQATSEIEELVTSLGGIVEFAGEKESSPERIAALEKEANELVDEIRHQAQFSQDGVKPLAGDKIRIEIEEKIGKTLEVILPDDARNAFELGSVSLSPKENIIKTQTSIAKARERLEALKSAVESGAKEITQAVQSLEVAMQNTEAATATVRDLEAAIALGDKTQSGISLNPKQAIDSVGEFSKASLDLLK